MRQSTKPKIKETLTKQKHKNTFYQRQYRTRKNVNKFHKSYPAYENEHWWDVLYALGETALHPLTFK
ncbi:hypothetical protein F8M41_016776 [Gigaspora margarita]|uniref:Uncharacterized protein n=1 Tax=Gigaspora margarita TaxID=4874 RepID=A0A8H4B383_GIGMA|nr:hypothetical protein F8M41_016776 [Gigaspora margarita]